ncbi:hypothetical protein GM528_13035, partial [Streptococcus pneumoniae]|nr:hypothetical protein [Streptococcus pneumoniae]
MTSIPVRGVKIKDGKLVKRAARLPPVLAAGKRHKADRIEQRLRENAAKSKAAPTIAWMK